MSTATARRRAPADVGAQRLRPRAPEPRPFPEQSAFLRRHIESIIAVKNSETGEVIEKTKKVGALVDKLNEEGALPFELFRAVEYFRELSMIAAGRSQGVSQYGDYVAGTEPSRRMITSEVQMVARKEFERAALAVFGTPRQDGYWAIDEQLSNIVMKAIFEADSKITKGWVGGQRTGDRYKGACQKQTTGEAVIVEILNKLSLHLCYRER